MLFFKPYLYKFKNLLIQIVMYNIFTIYEGQKYIYTIQIILCHAFLKPTYTNCYNIFAHKMKSDRFDAIYEGLHLSRIVKKTNTKSIIEKETKNIFNEIKSNIINEEINILNQVILINNYKYYKYINI